MAEVKYSHEAQNDLNSIKSYIENDLQNPTAAKRVLKGITTKNRLLETAPQIGTPLSSVIAIDTGYRFLSFGNYMSFYRFDKSCDTCYIDRVLYNRRDYLAILFGNANEADDIENGKEPGKR